MSAIGDVGVIAQQGAGNDRKSSSARPSAVELIDLWNKVMQDSDLDSNIAGGTSQRQRLRERYV